MLFLRICWVIAIYWQLRITKWPFLCKTIVLSISILQLSSELCCCVNLTNHGIFQTLLCCLVLSCVITSTETLKETLVKQGISMVDFYHHWQPLSLSDSLTHSVTFSRLDWCDPGKWIRQLKTCLGCNCCWCWWRGSWWQQFVADLEAGARSSNS